MCGARQRAWIGPGLRAEGGSEGFEGKGRLGACGGVRRAIRRRHSEALEGILQRVQLQLDAGVGRPRATWHVLAPDAVNTLDERRARVYLEPARGLARVSADHPTLAADRRVEVEGAHLT